MENKSRKIITILFFVIAGFALLGTIFSALTTIIWGVRIAIAMVFLIQGFGAWGLAKGVFSFIKLRPGIVIHGLKWLSGISAIISTIDFVMHFTKGKGFIPNISPLWFDGFVVSLFILWLLTAHFIAKDAKERKICEFC